MYLQNFIKLILIIVILVAESYSAKEDLSPTDDNLSLTLAELVNLVYDEKRRAEHRFENDHVPKSVKINVEDDIKSLNDGKDEERLKKRKVWSRWSKWSQCSVTCGPGTLTRRRLCVAGRCAPGEREEQRRTCALAPCTLLRVGEDGADADDLAAVAV